MMTDNVTVDPNSKNLLTFCNMSGDFLTGDSLITYKNCFSNTKNEILPSNMIAAIELLSLLRVSCASLNLYDKIVCWVKNRIPHSMNEMLPTEKLFMKIFQVTLKKIMILRI